MTAKKKAAKASFWTKRKLGLGMIYVGVVSLSYAFRSTKFVQDLLPSGVVPTAGRPGAGAGFKLPRKVG
jgi:hypothetical protein